MDGFTRKTFTTSRAFTYAYYHRVQNNQKPTLLLQHGFPDDHSLWAPVIPYLSQCGFSILLPDLLGYNGTSKPVDAESYNSKGMADDLAEILEAESIATIVSVGHDWGSYMAQRMWLWHPAKVTAVILLNVAYDPPAPFDLDRTNKAAESATGLPRLAYWDFFIRPDCAEIMRDNIDSWYEALHGSPENWLETLFCHHGALLDFVREGRRVPLQPYAEPLRENWKSCVGKFGFDGPLQWYPAKVDGHHWGIEREIPESRYTITAPVLFIGAAKDTVCTTAAIRAPQEGGLLPDLTVEEVDAGHWPMLEAPLTTGTIIARWLKERIGSNA